MLIRLIGVAVVIVGLVLKFDTIATVVLAGIVTGLVGGMSIMDIVSVNRMLAYDEERKKFLRRIKKEHFDAQETLENCMARVNRRVRSRKV